MIAELNEIAYGIGMLAVGMGAIFLVLNYTTKNRAMYIEETADSTKLNQVIFILALTSIFCITSQYFLVPFLFLIGFLAARIMQNIIGDRQFSIYFCEEHEAAALLKEALENLNIGYTHEGSDFQIKQYKVTICLGRGHGPAAYRSEIKFPLSTDNDLPRSIKKELEEIIREKKSNSGCP
ncbi:MAG: hypothetical protein H6619_02450 [Deltaproteobacteria bacterium]|nr:hypothetical protein [Deltaproteobacteria bacterium]